MFLRLTENNFEQDDGPIHDDAEVDGSERKQIRRDVRQMHHRERKEECERNGKSHNESPSYVSKKQYENDHHECDPFQQRPAHAFQGGVDELGPIQIGNDFNVFRKNPGIQLFHLFVDVDQYPRGIGAAQHVDNRGNRVTIFVKTQNTLPRDCSLYYLGDIANKDGGTFLLRDDDISHVLHARYGAESTDDKCLVSPVHLFSTRVGVIGGDRGDHIWYEQPVFR